MNSSHPWAERYRENTTPWDLGETHPELSRRIATGDNVLIPNPNAKRALVPGCGRGWDALAFADAGWEVSALDLVSELDELLTPKLTASNSKFICGDFFSEETYLQLIADGLFDLVFDHTFFCAIPLALREQFGNQMAKLIKPGGHLCSLVFPIGRGPELGGPPFGMEIEHLSNSLGKHNFELIEKSPNWLAKNGRAWDSAWVCFRHKTG